ncbi:ClC family H(+)/Cl(-) exchange transporter [Bifidobacterium longum]|uniref:chloride channel protein n=1 Tax=Bifidobacterium longum TaxID=216816 RepID=UPI000E4E6DE9|nr:chloride channel protein [Bifidobacterium longum]RHJ33745.1 ClC family H(+)/Cl(-) exchange transporter [Bifidobacterium longum]
MTGNDAAHDIRRLIPRFDHLKWKMAAAGIVIGLVSGLLVVVYRLGIEYGTDASRWIYARIRETPWLIAPWAVAAVAAALAIAWMVVKEPMAGGSGIPQTNGVVICGLKMRWQTILPVRFVGGLLGALFGLSGPIALPVGIWLPDVLGGGSNLIDTAEHARVGLGMLCLLFVAKMLFTSTSFGSGAPGGIFMPILAVGSLAGGICGEVLHRIGDLPSDAVAVFAACVMTGTLAASVKTPITSILLAVEMSGTLTHMLPVAAVAFIALLVSDLLRTKPIYGELLERYVRAQGMQMAIASHVGSGIMELPLEMGAIADGKRVRDVRWPSGCLIIGLRRGESEIVPRGDTRLRAGDYLVVLFSGEEEREVRPAMRRLCDARLD